MDNPAWRGAARNREVAADTLPAGLALNPAGPAGLCRSIRMVYICGAGGMKPRPALVRRIRETMG